MEEMTPRGRVLATFMHEPTDKVPVQHISFSSKIASMILGREAYVGGGIQQWREAKALWEGEKAHQEYLKRSLQDAFEVAKATDQDILRLEYWCMPEKPTERRDEYTFLYGDPRESWQLRRFHPPSETFEIIAQHPPKEELTFKKIEENLSKTEEWLESYSPKMEDFAGTRFLMETFGKEYVVRINGGGLSIPLNSVWLTATVRRPDLVARHLDTQAEMAVRQMKGFAEAGVKLLFGGGDFAGNDGPLYSPRAFHELMLPRLQRVAEICHKYGMYYLFGSDGNLWSVADDLFGKSGVNGYYEIDRRAGMDLRKLRKRFPDLVLIGNLSSHTLSQGTKDEVIAETLSCLKEAKRSGGIIVGCSNQTVRNTPKENLMAMIETIKNHR